MASQHFGICKWFLPWRAWSSLGDTVWESIWIPSKNLFWVVNLWIYRHWFKIGRPSSKSQKASFPTIWKASWALVTIAGRNGKNGWVGRALAHAITRITSTLPSKTKFLLITGKLMFFLRDKPECEEDRGVSKSQFILFRFLPVAYRNSVEQSNLWLYIYWFYRKRHATLYRCLNIFKSQTELSSGAALAR